MSPTSISLRSALAYAGRLFSQFPLAADLPNPLAILDIGSGSSVSSTADLDHSTASDVAVNPYIPTVGGGGASCPRDGPMSCHNSTPVAGDSCCFVYPSGRMLLTQFWDSHVHEGGSAEDWTIHGLWPDLCDGSYNAYCNMAPRFDNISDVLAARGQHELLAFMDRYWVADRGSNAHLWAHEWNKHGTCINTLAPRCYGNVDHGGDDDDGDEIAREGDAGEAGLDSDGYSAGLEVVDYFARATALFQRLDTHAALAAAGIVPSQRTRYPLADVQEALERSSGGKVVLRCGGRRDTLHEAWYVFFVRGSLQTGDFVPAQDLGRRGDVGNCVPWVRYLPKRGR